MAKSESGRIVIEVDPLLKRELYVALALSGCTLKDWFVRSAEIYCGDARQIGLFEKPVEVNSSFSHAREAQAK
jgi:hypothetical protein